MNAQDLIRVLRLRGRQSAGALVAMLGISRPTLMRAVRAADGAVIARGQARRSAYAARRALRGSVASLPLYRVGLDGYPRDVARIALTHPDGCAVETIEAFAWPLDADMRDGWFDGLPYPLQDMRPQGFLGRHFARQHAVALQASEDPSQWSEDDALYALCLLGQDTPGDFILGETACRLWLEHLHRARLGTLPEPITDAQLAAAYPALAEQAMAIGVAGSSAGGEFPKFMAVRVCTGPGAAQHALVKFSGADDSPGTQRWSDLLVCEHLAGELLRERLGIQAARSRVHRLGQRTFLEVERFDRHGLLGRSAVVSWSAVNGALFGMAGRPWTEAAQRLAERAWLTDQDAQSLARLWHFGRLIGNTDMHDGNLSFQPASSQGQASLTLAPAYDMLPMLYAPARGVELAPKTYSPSLPLPAEQSAWQRAADAAMAFWRVVAADGRISESFRRIGAQNAESLARLCS